jgi:hypothetical protein
MQYQARRPTARPCVVVWRCRYPGRDARPWRRWPRANWRCRQDRRPRRVVAFVFRFLGLAPDPKVYRSSGKAAAPGERAGVGCRPLPRMEGSGPLRSDPGLRSQAEAIAARRVRPGGARGSGARLHAAIEHPGRARAVIRDPGAASGHRASSLRRIPTLLSLAGWERPDRLFWRWRPCLPTASPTPTRPKPRT